MNVTLLVSVEHEVQALYLDGTFDMSGDNISINERICELMGIEIIVTDDFLLPGDDFVRTLGAMSKNAKKRKNANAEIDAEIAKIEETKRAADEKIAELNRKRT